MGSGPFRSSKELRQILDRVLAEIDADPEDGPRMMAAAAPLRIEVSDLGLVVNVAAAEKSGHCLDWNFTRRSRKRAKLELAMDAEVANRFLQGLENPALGIARGRMRTGSVDARAALRFFPGAKPLFEHYRELVAAEYTHLALE